MQTQVSSVRAGGAVALKDVRTSVRERGEDEAGLTILVPFPVPPPVPLPPVADHGLCSCLVVQAIPAAGSVGAVTEQMGTITALIPFCLFHTDSHSCWCSSQKTALRLSTANCPGLLGPPRNHLRGEKKTQKTT